MEYENSVTGTIVICIRYVEFIRPVDNDAGVTYDSRHKISIFPNKFVIGTGLHAELNTHYKGIYFWILHNEPGLGDVISELEQKGVEKNR